MKLAVSYARYSSDNQSETSIDDQQGKCRQFAEREGNQISREYADKAITEKNEHRPEYLHLLHDVKNGEIGTIYVDDLSRLSRSVNTAATIDELKFYGVRFVAIADGIDTDSKSSKMAVGMKAIMNNIFLDDLKDKVHRGLEGNALKDHNTGGRVYGYSPNPHYSETKVDIYNRPLIEFVTRVINEEQAAVVRQIFDWAAEGRSYNWIAHELNRRQIVAPHGGTWTSSTITSSVDGRPCGILNNQLYIGVSIWNKTEAIYNPLTNQQRSRSRDESEWIVRPREDLRIVSDEVWQAVKQRQERQKRKTEAKQKNTHKNARTGRTPKFLFSGVLKCGECGANLIMVDKRNYRCGSAHRRGEAVCTNKQKIARLEVEAELLSSVKDDLFDPASVNEFRVEAARLLKKRKGELDPTIKALMKNLKTLTDEEAGYLSALEICPEANKIRSVCDKLRSIEVAKQDIESQLAIEKSMVADISPILPRAEEIFREMVGNLTEALSDDIEPLRNQVVPIVGEEVKMTPDGEGGWEATFRGSFRGFLMLAASDLKISHEALRLPFFVRISAQSSL